MKAIEELLTTEVRELTSGDNGVEAFILAESTQKAEGSFESTV